MEIGNIYNLDIVKLLNKEIGESEKREKEIKAIANKYSIENYNSKEQDKRNSLVMKTSYHRLAALY